MNTVDKFLNFFLVGTNRRAVGLTIFALAASASPLEAFVGMNKKNKTNYYNKLNLNKL